MQNNSLILMVVSLVELGRPAPSLAGAWLGSVHVLGRSVPAAWPNCRESLSLWKTNNTGMSRYEAPPSPMPRPTWLGTTSPATLLDKGSSPLGSLEASRGSSAIPSLSANIDALWM